MPKDLWDSLKEWWVNVPQRWWDMLSIPITFIPLVAGIIAFMLWAANTSPPLPWWIPVLAIGGAVLFFVVSFLAFHKMKMERNKARKWQNVERREGMGEESLYDHQAYVARIIIDSKAQALLKLPNALESLAELDTELGFELGAIKRPKDKLRKILNRLQKDFEMQQLAKDARDETIWHAIGTTARDLNITGITVSDDMRAFMLHVAGVLDEEGIGISARRERADEYKTVIRLQASIATDELNGAVRAYLSYSLGVNSILLLFNCCPDEDVRPIMKMFGETTTELREERQAVLASLRTQIRALIETELEQVSTRNEA